MDAEMAGVIARVFPALVTLVLSTRNFNRSVMVLGIEAQRELCPDFENQRKHKDEKGNLDPFPCFRPGATALTLCYAAIAMATSMSISALISSNLLLRIFLGAWAVIMSFGMLAYLADYKKEMFKVEEALLKSSHNWWARHVGVGASLIAFVCSLILSVVSIMVP